MKLNGMRAVVTGGAMGIGLATAAGELGPVPVFSYSCDVTDRNRVFALADQAFQDMGGVDILINNAGFLAGGNFLDRPVEALVKTMDVNLKALLYTTYAILPGKHNG